MYFFFRPLVKVCGCVYLSACVKSTHEPTLPSVSMSAHPQWDEEERAGWSTPGGRTLANIRSSGKRGGTSTGRNMASPSPLRHAKTPMVNPGKSGNILSRRAEEAVRLKDEQLKLLQNQNRKLLQTIENMEQEVQDAKNSVGSLQSACLQAQDENIALKTEIRRALEEGQLTAETQFQKQIETSQHQIKVMAEQNTELLRLLESEEKKTKSVQTALDTMRTNYKGMVAEMETTRGKLEKDAEEMREGLERSQQRERELNLELEGKQEQARGLRMTINSLEEKLVKVSNANVELNSQLLDSQRAATAATDDVQTTAEEKIGNLEKELDTSRIKIDVELQEKNRLKTEVKDQADQLREMAEKVFQLIERLKDAEAAKRPLEVAVDRMQKDLRESNIRVIRVETERNDADKEARRFGSELKKARKQAEDAVAKKEDTNKLYNAEKKLRNQEQRARREAEESRKALSGRVSYLLNKSALDDESRANARMDVKKLEKTCRELAKTVETLRSKLSNSQEANKVMAEAMRLKHEEIEKLRVDSKMRHWDKKAKNRAKTDMRRAKNNVFGKRGDGESINDPYGDDSDDDIVQSSNTVVRGKKSSGLAHGTGFSVVMMVPKGRTTTKIPGLKADKGDDRAKMLLTKLQINEFFNYVSSRPVGKYLEMAAEKFAQVLGALRLSESLSAARGRKAMETMDRLRSEMDMIRRKAQSQADRIFEEEEAKRKALVKYLSLVVETKSDAPSVQLSKSDLGRVPIPSKRDMDGGTGFFMTEDRQDDAEDQASPNAAARELLEHSVHNNRASQKKVTVSLCDNKIGDEEIHALVAVLSANDNAHVIDLKNNNITDTGCRGLAALLRSTHTLEEIDLRGNSIGRPGIRVLAEAIEHNMRVKHVFVHDKGRIEALGTLTGDGNEARESKLGEETPSGDPTVDPGYVDTVLTIDVEDQQSGPKPEPYMDPISMKLEDIGDTKEMPGDKKDDPHKFETPLSRRIKEMELHLGPRANAAPNNGDQAEMIAILEAEKWATRAENLRDERGLEEVPTDWLGTETHPVPEAYESPLTKRIQDLENRLAITDFTSQSAPPSANELMESIATSRGDLSASEGEGYEGNAEKTIFAKNSERRSKSAKGIRSNSKRQGAKVWRHDSASSLQRSRKETRGLNQETQIDENLRRKDAQAARDKNEKENTGVPRSRAIRAAYAVRTLDEEQIDDSVGRKIVIEENLMDELDIEDNKIRAESRRPRSASVARRRQKKTAASLSSTAGSKRANPDDALSLM